MSLPEKCEVKNCRGAISVWFKGKGICEKHWNHYCDTGELEL